MNKAQVAIVIAKTAMDVMMFTPVIFLFPNTNESKPKMIESNPVDNKTNDKNFNQIESELLK